MKVNYCPKCKNPPVQIAGAVKCSNESCSFSSRTYWPREWNSFKNEFDHEHPDYVGEFVEKTRKATNTYHYELMKLNEKIRSTENIELERAIRVTYEQIERVNNLPVTDKTSAILKNLNTSLDMLKGERI